MHVNKCLLVLLHLQGQPANVTITPNTMAPASAEIKVAHPAHPSLLALCLPLSSATTIILQPLRWWVTPLPLMHTFDFSSDFTGIYIAVYISLNRQESCLNPWYSFRCMHYWHNIPSKGCPIKCPSSSYTVPLLTGAFFFGNTQNTGFPKKLSKNTKSQSVTKVLCS